MSQEHVIEAIWFTKAGLAAVVIMTGSGHRCGYVGVLPGHGLHRVGYSEDTFALLPPPADTPIGKRGIIPLFIAGMRGTIGRSPEMVFDVHGGLTFSGKLEIPLIEERFGKFDVWWLGYDCAHAGDAPSPEYVEQMKERYPDKPFMWREPNGVHRTHGYCVSECEALAQQIRELTVSPRRAWFRKVWHAITNRERT